MMVARAFVVAGINCAVRSPGPLAGLGREHEGLSGQVRVDVLIAHERDHLAAGRLFDEGDEVLAHYLLKAPAHVYHDIGLALVDEPVLGLGQRVTEDDRDQIARDGGARLGGPAPGVVPD